MIVFPYWLVPALQWATSTRDPMGSGHGYAQNIMNWSPIVAGPDGLDWKALADVGQQVYGTRDAVHPASAYANKAIPAIWHGHRSVIKDSLTFNLERALQVRNWGRCRQVDERVIPHLMAIENRVNPVLGQGVGLDRTKFATLMDEYYTLRGWDVTTGHPTPEKLGRWD